MSHIGKLQTWKIPIDKLGSWRRLNPDVPKETATDCTINSLHFLGVIDNPDFAKILSDFANANQRGLRETEVLQLIYNKFNEENDYQIKNYTMGSKKDTEIRSELVNNTYTIAGYLRPGGQLGHAVILTKQNGIIYVLDPQQETVYCELTNYIDWVNSQNFARDEHGAPLISYILKNKITRKRNDTNISLRRQRKSRSPPTKKRRITNSFDGGNRTRRRTRRQK